MGACCDWYLQSQVGSDHQLLHQIHDTIETSVSQVGFKNTRSAARTRDFICTQPLCCPLRLCPKP
jgi:hypothetical protein